MEELQEANHQVREESAASTISDDSNSILKRKLPNPNAPRYIGSYDI